MSPQAKPVPDALCFGFISDDVQDAVDGWEDREAAAQARRDDRAADTFGELARGVYDGGLDTTTTEVAT